ncbi:RNA recognition motif domain-containing protein [Patescibacteria group bacterium]
MSVARALHRNLQRGGETNLNKKLFVGNLDWTLTSDDLRDHFAKAGKVVDAVVIMDRQTGRSKGFGFVEFETEEEAAKAIEMFNEKELKGRAINVNEAKPPRQD